MAELTVAPHHNDHPSSSMAPCSGSTSYVHYDVVINICSKDTDADTFATSLKSCLEFRGLQVYMGKLEFMDEEEAASQMEATISLASVQIPIFSPNYAAWKWCLDVLVRMTKSEVTILPVFYKVKPSELRWTDKNHNYGTYALWLADHEDKERYDLQTIQDWRDVLRRASEITGFEVEACNGNEKELLTKIVERVFDACPPRDFDVFINHRGPDTKKQYAFPLYNRLKSRELRVFLDEPELVAGFRITPQIEVAIQFASVHIAIFSKRYAQSNWCLDELYLMTKSGATILPIFYEVEPSVLDGVYVEALNEHEEKGRYNKEHIQKWRGALFDVAKLHPFVLDGNDENILDLIEGILKNVPKRSPVVQSSEVQSVANCVLKGNDPKRCNVVQSDVEHCFGLMVKLKEFEKAVLLEHQEEHAVAKVVGVMGDGGVGKTTLAKEFFRVWKTTLGKKSAKEILKCKKLNHNESFFLFDVRQHACRVPLKDLLKELVKELKIWYIVDQYKYGYIVDQYKYGYIVSKQDLSYYRALVILDDANDVQLNALLPIKQLLHPKSLVLVTSRDKDVLERSGIVDSIYHLTGLNELHSPMLFCSYAFLAGYPSPGFADLIDKFVTACHGLPLLLKVLGALLCGEDRSFWQMQLNKLPKCIEPTKIYPTLKISYDSLKPEEQQIFLDISCFFIGIDKDTAIRILGMTALEKLEKRCLLEVDSKNEIQMHDNLRDLGRHIANELMPGRLWHQTTKNIDDLLEQSSSVPFQFRGITMIRSAYARYFSDEPEACLPSKMPYDKRPGVIFPNQIRCPTNLKFVAAEGGYLEDILRVGSPDLIWLQWSECPCSNLPSWIPMKNLRVLEVSGSKLTELWGDGSEAPLQLRELNIFAPLSAFPKSLGQLKHLEKIVLKNLWSLLPITTLPEEFCHLHSLEYLELRDCSSMRSLPDSFGELTKLLYIDLKGASSLLMLPHSFGNLTLLKHLSLRECRKIQKLSGLEHLTSLETLDVHGCEKLQGIQGLWQLTNLQTLNVSGCCEIEALPGLEHLTSLQTLDVQGCKKLQGIQGLWQLTNLQTLNVNGCCEIEALPGLEHLTSLEILKVRGCQKLQGIQGLWQLTNLQTLNVSGCCEIEALPGLEHLTSLQTLDVQGCKKLQGIQGLWQLTNLQTLNVSGCCEIEALPGLEHLTSLEILKVWGCKKLQGIQGLWQLTNLQTLDVSECCEIEALPGLEYLTSLETLVVCCEIEALPGLEYLTSLETLDVRGCQKLQSIQGLGQLIKLQRLYICGCPEMQKLQLGVHEMQERPGVEHLISNLETLDVRDCKKLQSIEGLGQLIKLQTLEVYECPEIQKLQLGVHEMPERPGVEDLTYNLETLDVRDCKKLQSIEGLGQLTKLQILYIRGCPEIQKLQLGVHEMPERPGVEDLTYNLETLHVIDCKKLQSIEGLGQLTKLQILYIRGCPEIQKLQLGVHEMPERPGVEDLTYNLETLDVRDCKKLQSIEGLGQLIKLQTLEVYECPEIQKLQLGVHEMPERPGVEDLTYNLETLHVIDCKKLQSIEGLGQLIKLQTLEVYECPEIQKLQLGVHEMPERPGVEDLTYNLEKLNVRGCKKLQSIQGLGQLIKLQTLEVYECPEIQKLQLGVHEMPERPGVEDLTYNLKTLDVRDCKKLQSIEGLGQLIKLQTLEVYECPEIQKLQLGVHEMPERPGVEDLTYNLETLDVRDCKKLQSIEGLGQLTKLQILYIRGCPEIQKLQLGVHEMPERPGVEDLTYNLETLDVRDCKKLQSIEGLGQLTKLQILYIRGCPEIQKLQLGVHEMPERPGVEDLTYNLETLHVIDCKKLQSIEGLGQLTKLQILYIRGCPEIQKLQLGVHEMPERPGVEDLTYNLETLDVRDCKKLQSIEGLGQLIKLQTLEVYECPEIQKLQLGVHEMPERPGVEDLTYNLETLNVRDCKKLQSIEGLGQLTKLQILYIRGCPEIQKLQLGVHEMPERPGVEDLTYNLETLDVRDCKKLQSIEGLGQLIKLQTLEVYECPEIQKLQLGVHEMPERPGVEDFTYNLKTLDVRDCKKLQSIEGLGQLTKLQILYIRGCPEIQKLQLGVHEMPERPGVEDLTYNLKTLDVRDCKKLQSIEGLGQLTKLQILYIRGCPEIQKLQLGVHEMPERPGVEDLTYNLETLDVRDCKKLQSIEGLGQLTKLQILYIRGCPGIQKAAARCT